MYLKIFLNVPLCHKPFWKKSAEVSVDCRPIRLGAHFNYFIHPAALIFFTRPVANGSVFECPFDSFPFSMVGKIVMQENIAKFGNQSPKNHEIRQSTAGKIRNLTVNRGENVVQSVAWRKNTCEFAQSSQKPQSSLIGRRTKQNSSGYPVKKKIAFILSVAEKKLNSLTGGKKKSSQNSPITRRKIAQNSSIDRGKILLNSSVIRREILMIKRDSKQSM